MADRKNSSSRVAIAGASSLLGKELKQVLEDRNFPASETILLDESVAVGTLTEAGGEPTFIRELEEDSFEGARFVFFAGKTSDAARNWPAAQRAGATVIDLTGAASSESRATLWIPGVHTSLPPQVNEKATARVYASPSTPVLIACTLSAALQALSPQRIVLTLIVPVSEYDQPGVEELEAQTASLLSFREISKTLFDTQIAFNMLTSFGPESKAQMNDLRAAIAREAAVFLSSRAPVPAIQVVHAPVFYGYAFAAYAEFAVSADSAQIESALAKMGVKIAAENDPPLSNVSVAGENEIQLARVAPDPNIREGAWLWGAADNLRLASTNAVRIAEELLRAQ